MTRVILFAAMFALWPVAVSAEGSDRSTIEPADAEPMAPSIGPALTQPAPNVELVRPSGESTGLENLMGEKGVAITFVRSADWCPYCQKQLKQIDEISPELRELGWPLVAVSYDDSTILKAFGEKHALSFELLSDPQSEAITAFNLLNTDMKPGSRYYGIPHPAIVFVGSDQTVRAVLREDGYKDRPSLDVILQIAEQL